MAAALRGDPWGFHMKRLRQPHITRVDVLFIFRDAALVVPIFLCQNPVVWIFVCVRSPSKCQPGRWSEEQNSDIAWPAVYSGHDIKTCSGFFYGNHRNR